MIAGLGVLGVVLLGCGDPELELRVQELERRVQELEARGAVPVTGATAVAAPTATPEQEQAAADLLRDASEAMKRLDWDTARAKIASIERDYPSTRAARATVRLQTNLDVIGKPEGELAVERWFRGGEADVASADAKVLVFWEAWCSHCRRDMPRMNQIAERYRGRLAVLGLTKMTKGVTDEQVETFLRELDVRFPVAKENGDALSRHYGVLGIPAAAVVVDGKVAWRGSPVELEDPILDQLLKGR